MENAIRKQMFEGSQFVQLLYNRPSKSLIACFQRFIAEHAPVNDMYHRRSTDSEYRKLPKADDLYTYLDPVCCKQQPYLFLNVKRWNKSMTGTEWVSLSKVSLPDGTLSVVMNSLDLQLPDGCSRGWIASLLDVDERGVTAICHVALDSPTGPGISKVEYSISEIDLKTGHLSCLARLPDVFM